MLKISISGEKIAERKVLKCKIIAIVEDDPATIHMYQKKLKKKFFSTKML